MQAIFALTFANKEKVKAKIQCISRKMKDFESTALGRLFMRGEAALERLFATFTPQEADGTGIRGTDEKSRDKSIAKMQGEAVSGGRENAKNGENDEAKESERLFRLLRRMSLGMIPALFSALLAMKRFPLDTYPLGIALCAAGGSDTLFLSLGTLLPASLSGNMPLAVGTVSLFLLRVVFSAVFTSGELRIGNGGFACGIKEMISRAKKGIFRESDTMRLSASALAAFTMGFVKTAVGGFGVGDLVGTCITVVLCPVLTYLYTGASEGSERRGIRYFAGTLTLLASFVYAVSAIKPLGFSLSLFSAAFISLIMARRKKPLFSGIFSLITVFAAEPVIAPAFALSAVIATLLFEKSKLFAVFGSAIVFAGVGFVTGGGELFASSFPEYLSGAVLSLFVSNAVAYKLLPAMGSAAMQANADAEILKYKERDGRASIEELSRSFEELSKSFFELSDRDTRPEIFDTRRIIDRVCDRYCRRCSACTLCWERDYDVTVDTVNKISAKMYKRGHIEKSDLPSEFVERCHNADKIVADIEKENTALIRELLNNDRGRIGAMDLGIFSRILAQAVEKNDMAYEANSEARAKLLPALRSIGFTADAIGVFGKREMSVFASRLGADATKCTADEILTCLKDTLGCSFEAPYFEFSDGGINMMCRRAPDYSVTCSVASVAGAAEENGDRVVSFDGKNGYFYALVSDGMGSGRSAARKSEAAGLLLEKMLRAGNSMSSGLEMLSAFAHSDSDEVFTTVDLFEFDRFCGRGCFVKSGAAPSFVRRGDRIFKIRSRTCPIGILDNVDAEKTAFDCESGDTVIILSDGVTEDIEEPVWLCEFLMKADLSLPSAAENILSEAKRHTLCRDDMTAAVIRIEKSA